MIDKTTVAGLPTIVLAGGHKNIRLHDFATLFTDMYRYHEHYLPLGSYKTTREIHGSIAGQSGRFPLILYILHTLTRVAAIGPVKVVGPAPELKAALDRAPFPVDRFELIPQGQSFGSNVMLGYQAIGSKGHALLVMGDSPLTTTRCIEDFIALSRNYLHRDFILPVVKAAILDELARFMPRPYIRLLPEGLEPAGYCTASDLDSRGRIGCRLSSLALANLTGTTAEQIDHLRSLRKALRPAVQKMLRKELGTNVLIQYRRGITFSWLAEKFEHLYFKSMQVVGLPHAGAALDVDSSADLQSISRIMRYRRRRHATAKTDSPG
ncbi:MAG: hypothetical protein ABIA75_14115 [Candidatus Neomarinimicrobiota bacterium]